MAKAKAKPEWQRLIARCQKLWEAYDKAPTKKRLEAFGAHLEKMKASKSITVKAERTGGARAFKQQKRAAKRRAKPKRNPGIPGFRKGLSKTSRDALVVGLTVEPTPFNVKRRTMRTLVKLELAEVVDDLQGSANLELTPLGRNAATTIAENRYYDIEEGELSPALIIKMGLPQLNARKAAKKKPAKPNPAGRRVAITQDELADTIASRLHRAGREVTMVSVGE
jgi:hypothetical protein